VPLSQLHRVRWAVRATLALGVAASVVANVLHAQPHPISQAIAAWPPLALLLTVELISRVPVHSRALAATRFASSYRSRIARLVTMAVERIIEASSDAEDAVAAAARTCAQAWPNSAPGETPSFGKKTSPDKAGHG